MSRLSKARPRQRRPGNSLPIRVLVTTLVASTLVLVLAGLLLLQQVTSAITDTKKASSVSQAIGIYRFMQQQLRLPETRGVAVYEQLSRLADQAGSQAGQYHVVIEGPASIVVSQGIRSGSVPEALRAKVTASDGLFVTPGRAEFTDGSSEPAWVVGATLTGISGESYPVYYVFPMTSEVETLQHIREAIVSTGAILLLALALVSYLVTVQIVRPVRRASQTALRLASGDLDERMVVKGSDEIAMLADSMNVMAEDLQARIHQLEQLSQLERRFVSDVSHELRTPMTTIKMAADLLYGERASFAPQAARTAELMSDEIDRFDELLADLLEISRFDAGAAVLTLERTDVVDLVAGEISAQNSFAAKLGTSIELQAESEVTARVDRRRIRRIVRNLLTNAIEHAEGKPITVKVAAADDEVSIEVIDQGVGFDEEQAEHVFERFWRADPSRTRVVGGSGLGLSIAQEDARLHGGKILAEGQPDQGARFQVQFPQRLRSGDKPAASEAQS